MHYAKKSTLAHLPQDDPGRLPDSAMRRYDRHVSNREPGADVISAAYAAEELLRHRGTGGDYPARADCRQHDASLLAAPAEREAVKYPHPSLEPVLETHIGCTAVSGATIEDGDDARGFYRRRGGRIAARDGIQTFGSTHERNRE